MPSGNSAIARYVQSATKIQPNELKATLFSFTFVFLLMAAYFILRPVRDAMSSDWTDQELSWLWTSTFAFSTLAVVAYGAIIPRIRFERLVPSVYAFFSASFIAFYFGSSLLPDPVWVDKTFYVWLSVFSLFHVSVFWSFMSGLFNKEQAPRLFAVIATGASAGAVAGPLIPTL
ncbi:MAG: MFS transporter, partial [Woeseia sp.]|nr:MFS transporter [Woeseia sp.]